MTFFLFGTATSNLQPQIFGLDANLLSLALSAKLAQQTASTSLEARIFADFANFGPAVKAPWEINPEPGTLASRIRTVRDLEKFIDLKSDDVKRAGDDKDSRALFALYNALTALETLAQYAAEKTTPEISLPRLNLQFQKGLAEIRDFISTAKLDRLTLFFGVKEDDVTSGSGLSKFGATAAGEVIQKGNRGDALTGVVGNEIFNVRIEKGGSFDDITVDLSNIAGTLNIDAVVNEINAQIRALTVLDAGGNPVPKYQSTFSVRLNDDFDYFIQLDGSSLEKVSLIPQTGAPALIVAGTQQDSGSSQTAAVVTTISSINTANPLHNLAQDISGTDPAATEVAQKVALADDPDAEDVDAVTKQSSTGGIAVDSVGNIYVVGSTAGNVDGQVNAADTSDVFLTKFDSNGNVIYSRLLGANDNADAFNITIDSNDNVIIVGQTNSDLSTTDVLDSTDAFVSKFASNGDLIFTYQLDTFATTDAAAVAVDAAGNIYVGGSTSGDINITSGFAGSKDSLILKIDGTTGTLLSSQLIGGTGSEQIKDIAIASDGGILIATVEDGSGFLRKLDANDLSVEIYNVALGGLSGGTIGAIAVDGTAIYVGGTTGDAAFDGGGGSVTNAHSGGQDGFVTRIDDAGASATTNFTTFVGSTGTDKIADVVVSGGSVYVGGLTTGSINGEKEIGLQDSFIAKLDGTSGAITFVEQFGTALGTSEATGIAFTSSGRSVLDFLGLKTGVLNEVETADIETQTSARAGDFFFISIDGGPKRRITIKAGDDFEDLARKINLLSLRGITAESFTGENGPTLRIKAINGSSVELFAGTGDKDALGRLGMEPTKLLASALLFQLDVGKSGFDPEDLGGVFGLNLTNAFHIEDKTTAQYVLTQLTNATATLQRAFRTLSFDPVRAKLLEDARFKGTVPPHLLAQIANFQAGLDRLQSGIFGGGISLFI